MTDKQIIIDGCDVSGCCHQGKDNTCTCPHYKKECGRNPNCHYKIMQRQTKKLDEFYKRELGIKQKLFRKEQECERWKLLNNRLNSALGYKRAGKKTFIDLSVELDQLKAENETLKQYKASKQASYESMQREWNQAVNKNRELKQTLTEIKEIAEDAGNTQYLTFPDFNLKQNVKMLMGQFNGYLQQILQKISEVEDGQ